MKITGPQVSGPVTTGARVGAVTSGEQVLDSVSINGKDHRRVKRFGSCVLGLVGSQEEAPDGCPHPKRLVLIDAVKIVDQDDQSVFTFIHFPHDLLKHAPEFQGRRLVGAEGSRVGFPVWAADLGGTGLSAVEGALEAGQMPLRGAGGVYAE